MGNICIHPEQSVPKEHTVAGDMYTHSMPNYERILKEGLLSYLPRIWKIDDKDMREGLVHLIEGIGTLVSRCVEYPALRKAVVERNVHEMQ